MIKDQIVSALLGIIGQALVRSLRIEIIGIENYQKLKNNQTPVIFAMWHSRLLLFSRFAARHQVSTLISPGRDGEIGARIASRLGINMVRGNSNYRPIASARRLRYILEQGMDIGIFADGPSGPAGKLKPGIISLSRYVKKSQILPAGADASWKITFRGSWDNFILPLPFSKVVITLGNPINIPRDIHKQQVFEIAGDLEQQINDLNTYSTATLYPQRNQTQQDG